MVVFGQVEVAGLLVKGEQGQRRDPKTPRK
jgi:hypothetical protein